MEVPRHWRLKKQRYAMVGEVCTVCDSHIFPPRPVCPYCGGEKLEFSLGDKGQVVDFETVHADIMQQVPLGE